MNIINHIPTVHSAAIVMYLNIQDQVQFMNTNRSHFQLMTNLTQKDITTLAKGLLESFTPALNRVTHHNESDLAWAILNDPTKWKARVLLDFHERQKIMAQRIFDLFTGNIQSPHFPHLNSSQALMLAVLKYHPRGPLYHSLHYASKELKDNKEIVMAAVSQDGSALQYASKELQDDKDIVKAAAAKDRNALKYASERVRNDKKTIMVAVTQFGYALKFASKGLQDNDDIVMAAVMRDGHALAFASKRLKNDKETVLAAINQIELALLYASDELKDDREVVMAAIAKEGSVIEYASERLQKDQAILAAKDTAFPTKRARRD